MSDKKISEEVVNQIRKIADSLGYTSAFMLVSKYKGYSVAHLVNTKVQHCKYEGIPYYVVWNEKENVRPATLEERWEIMGMG